MPSGYSATVPTDTLLDTAVIKIGTTPIGVTRGGVRIRPGRELRSIPYDGQKSAHAVGLDRIVGFADRVEATVMEFAQGSLDRLQNVSGGAPAVPKAGEIFTSARYLTDVRIVHARSGGGVVEWVYPKALVQWGELVGEDKNEVVAPIAIEAALNFGGVVTTDDAPYSIVHTPSGGGGGGPTPLNDTFTRTGNLHNSAADSGHVWTVHDGTFDTNGTRARCTALGAPYAWATVDLGTANFEYTYNAHAAGTFSWCPFRWVDINNFLMVEHAPGQSIILYKRVAGTFTNLGSDGGGADGDAIKNRANGTAIEIFKNGVSIISITEAAHQTATRAGVGASVANKEWDNTTSVAL